MSIHVLLWISSCVGNRSSNVDVLPYKILDRTPLNTKLYRVNKTKLLPFNVTESRSTHTYLQTKSILTS